TPYAVSVAWRAAISRSCNKAPRSLQRSDAVSTTIPTSAAKVNTGRLNERVCVHACNDRGMRPPFLISRSEIGTPPYFIPGRPRPDHSAVAKSVYDCGNSVKRPKKGHIPGFRSRRNRAMCIAYLSLGNPDWPLLIAANRDEFHARPARAAGPWPETPQLIAGLDLRGGGTWIGATAAGRFALLTNYREPRHPI